MVMSLDSNRRLTRPASNEVKNVFYGLLGANFALFYFVFVSSICQ